MWRLQCGLCPPRSERRISTPMPTNVRGRPPGIKISPNSIVGLIRPGTILVVDNQARDDGFCGSNMGLSLFGLGLRGFVGNEVCRDTPDEMTLTRIPVYQDPALSPRGINPGRMWVESYNEPVVVGHVLVMPGDIVVADNEWRGGSAPRESGSGGGSRTLDL